MHRTIKPFFHDYLPRQDLFLELVELALMGYGVIVSHRAVGFDAQGSIQIEVSLWFDMNIGLVYRNHPKLPVVCGKILQEKGVGLIPGLDPLKPHLLHQPILKHPEQPLDATLGLR